MQESVVVLLENLMGLEQHFVTLYQEISEKSSRYAIKNAANILSREEERHVKIYNNLIDSIEELDDATIDKEIKEQAVYNMIMLRRNMNVTPFGSVKDLITLAVDFENKNIYIISEIIRQIKESKTKVHHKVIEIFDGLLSEQEKHLKNLKRFL